MDLEILFSKLISTLAVILVMAGVLAGSNLLEKFLHGEKAWKYSLIAGVMGGLFGIYGNVTGVELSGAVITVRDIGPMLAGLVGGPLGGLLGGLICGVHRYSMGGVTAQACVLATCCIGTACGFLSQRQQDRLIKPVSALALGAVMEVFHLGVVLVMVKPFSLALSIVRQIAVPFILVNAVGFTLLIFSILFIEKKRVLDQERSRLQSELEVATVIQRSLLPHITDTYPGRKEFSLDAFMDPAKEVGGDFYDFFFLGSDKLALIIADVSGKGVPGALFMAAAKLTLQGCIRDNADLAEAVSAANEALCANNEAEMFVTAWIGVLDIPSGRVDYICAGHNPPLLITAEDAEYVRCKSCFVLAGMEGTRYRKESVTLAPGDKLFLYTDGVTEAEDAKHVLYGEERLQRCLRLMRDVDPDTVIRAVRADIAKHVRDYAQFDDITMLCLQRNVLPEDTPQG